MIDHIHTPIWLRCTERWKIDPTYQRGFLAREMKDIDRSRMGNDNHKVELAPDAQAVLDHLLIFGPTTTSKLCEVSGASNGRMKQITTTIGSIYPIYEDLVDGEMVYGLLEVHSDYA